MGNVALHGGGRDVDELVHDSAGGRGGNVLLEHDCAGGSRC